jgi:hypothetical protein
MHTTGRVTHLPGGEDIDLAGVSGELGDDDVGERKSLNSDNLAVDSNVVTSSLLASIIITRAVDKNLIKY